MYNQQGSSFEIQVAITEAVTTMVLLVAKDTGPELLMVAMEIH
jgi:hypothetical protein